MRSVTRDDLDRSSRRRTSEAATLDCGATDHPISCTCRCCHSRSQYPTQSMATPVDASTTLNVRSALESACASMRSYRSWRASILSRDSLPPRCLIICGSPNSASSSARSCSLQGSKRNLAQCSVRAVMIGLACPNAAVALPPTQVVDSHPCAREAPPPTKGQHAVGWPAFAELRHELLRTDGCRSSLQVRSLVIVTSTGVTAAASWEVKHVQGQHVVDADPLRRITEPATIRRSSSRGVDRAPETQCAMTCYLVTQSIML